MDLQTIFDTYWDLITGGDHQFDNRKDAARVEWDAHPEKQEPILRWLKQHGAYNGRNPYFFIQDFKVRAVPHPVAEPTDMNGRALQQGVQYVTAKYNGKWGTYSMEDVKKFRLELP